MRRTLSGLVVGAAFLAAATPARAPIPRGAAAGEPLPQPRAGGQSGDQLLRVDPPQQQLQSNLQQVQAALLDEQRFAGSQELLANQAVVTGNYANYGTQGRYFMTRGGAGFSPRTAGYPGVLSPTAGPGGFGNQPAGVPTGRPSVRR